MSGTFSVRFTSSRAFSVTLYDFSMTSSLKIFPETDQEWVGLTVVLGMSTISLMLLDEAMEVLNRGLLPFWADIWMDDGVFIIWALNTPPAF